MRFGRSCWLAPYRYCHWRSIPDAGSRRIIAQVIDSGEGAVPDRGRVALIRRDSGVAIDHVDGVVGCRRKIWDLHPKRGRTGNRIVLLHFPVEYLRYAGEEDDVVTLGILDQAAVGRGRQDRKGALNQNREVSQAGGYLRVRDGNRTVTRIACGSEARTKSAVTDSGAVMATVVLALPDAATFPVQLPNPKLAFGVAAIGALEPAS